MAGKLNESLEAERERISRAKEYCAGYSYGVYEGRKHSTSEADAGESPSYRAGFRRGVSAANRAKYGESSRERDEKEIISDAIARLEDEYLAHQHYTEEQAEEWKRLQANIKANGEKSWEDLLLELYERLGLYEGPGSLLTHEERAATNLLRTGIIKRLARTSLVLPVPG